MKGETEMKLSIAETEVKEAIDAQVKTIIAKALKRNGRELIETVVAHALSEKKNSYDRETVFGAAVNQMIRTAAKESMDEWIAEQKHAIRAAVTNRLKKEKRGFVEAVADKIITGLAENFYVSCNLKVED